MHAVPLVHLNISVFWTRCYTAVFRPMSGIFWWPKTQVPSLCVHTNFLFSLDFCKVTFNSFNSRFYLTPSWQTVTHVAVFFHMVVQCSALSPSTSYVLCRRLYYVIGCRNANISLNLVGIFWLLNCSAFFSYQIYLKIMNVKRLKCRICRVVPLNPGPGNPECMLVWSSP